MELSFLRSCEKSLGWNVHRNANIIWYIGFLYKIYDARRKVSGTARISNLNFHHAVDHISENIQLQEYLLRKIIDSIHPRPDKIDLTEVILFCTNRFTNIWTLILPIIY